MSILDIKPRQLVWQSPVLVGSPGSGESVSVSTPILRQYKTQLEIPEGSVEQPAWQSYGMAGQALDARYAPNCEVAFYVLPNTDDNTIFNWKYWTATLILTDYGTDGFSGALDNSGMVTTVPQVTYADVTAELMAGRGYLLVPMASVQVGKLELQLTSWTGDSWQLRMRVEAYSCQDTPNGIGPPKNGTPALLVPETGIGVNVACHSGGATRNLITNLVTARANSVTVLAHTDNTVDIWMRSYFAGNLFYADQKLMTVNSGTSNAATTTTGIGLLADIYILHNGGGADATVTGQAIARS